MKTLTVTNLNIKYTYGALAISELSFTAKQGSVFCVLGKEEAGKTSLLKCIAGLENRADGSIKINDREIINDRPKARNVCIIAPNEYFFERKSVEYNLEYILKIRKTPKEEAEAIIKSSLKKAELSEEILRKKINTLTKVEKIKCALAKCFLRKADIYLIDNILSETEELKRGEIFPYVKNLLEELAIGAVVIYATDSGDECLEMASDTIFLDYGICMQRGSSDMLCNEPMSISALKAFHNDCEITEGKIIFSEGEIILDRKEKIKLDKDKLLSDIFIGKTVLIADCCEKIRIFDAVSERLIYFN